MAHDVLLFDLDGTLVDSAQGIAAALNAVRGERGGAPLPIAAVRPLVALGADALVMQGLGELATKPRDDLAALRRYLADVPSDPAALYPDVPIALDTLARAGWRMSVVTNKPEALARKLLADLDLARTFDAIVGGNTIGAPKPSPEPLYHALHLLGASATAAIFVGDSGIDAAAARACAMPFLLFEGGYGAADCAPEYVAGRFDRFGDLPGLVAAFELDRHPSEGWHRSPAARSQPSLGSRP